MTEKRPAPSAALRRTTAVRKSAKKPPKPTLWQIIADHPVLAVFFGPKTPDRLAVTPPDPWGGSAASGRQIVAGKFNFAGQSFQGDPAPWKPDGANPDFLSALHGFEWLRDLRSLGGDAARLAARGLVRDWLQHHKRWDAVAWRPDIVGTRLASWIGLHDFFLGSADDGYRQTVFAAIQKQSRYLGRALPGNVKGAALIAALRGWIYSCLALPQQQTRLFQALTLLHDELRAQILPDGGHIERNPSTHAQVLCHLIDIRAALRGAGLAVPDILHATIHAMAPILRFYRHGDGALTLFNGASEGDVQRFEMILQQAHAAGKTAASAPHTGYERLNLGRSLVLFDVGTPPENFYAAQIHAAPLAFEFSVARERVVVNCGHAGSLSKLNPMGFALRQTAAHSALTVANTNAVGLRPDGGIVRAPKTIHLHEESTREQMLVAATHDGYHTALGVLHTRQLYLGDGGEDFRGQDTLVGTAGHPFAIRFHLHPDVRASLTGNNAAVLLRLRSGAGWRFRCSGAQLSLEESLYHPQPGEASKSTMQIVLTGHSTDRETVVKWSFKREKKPRTADKPKPGLLP